MSVHFVLVRGRVDGSRNDGTLVVVEGTFEFANSCSEGISLSIRSRSSVWLLLLLLLLLLVLLLFLLLLLLLGLLGFLLVVVRRQ